jgi:hypothetical protein
MPASAGDTRLAARREFTLNCLLPESRPVVFRAFVEPERMKQWWAPRGFHVLSCALDLREDGAWRMRIRSDDTDAIQTEVASAQSDFHSPDFCRSHEEGWSPPLEKLTHYVPRIRGGATEERS